MDDLLVAWAPLTDDDVLAACEDAFSYYMSPQLPFPAPFHADNFRATQGFNRLTRLCADVLAARVGKPVLEKRIGMLASATPLPNQRLVAARLCVPWLPSIPRPGFDA